MNILRGTTEARETVKRRDVAARSLTMTKSEPGIYDEAISHLLHSKILSITKK